MGNLMGESEVIDDMNADVSEKTIAQLIKDKPAKCVKVELKQGTFTLVVWEA